MYFIKVLRKYLGSQVDSGRQRVEEDFVAEVAAEADFAVEVVEEGHQEEEVAEGEALVQEGRCWWSPTDTKVYISLVSMTFSHFYFEDSSPT